MGEKLSIAGTVYDVVSLDAAEGWFSLVLERRPEGVRIVHDHSS